MRPANTLNNPLRRPFSRAFNFAAYDAGTTNASAPQLVAVKNNAEQIQETKARQDSRGAKLAPYLAPMAPQVTGAFNIFADNIFKAGSTTFGLPAETSIVSINVQAKTVTSALNLSDRRNPMKQLHKLIERFTAFYGPPHSPSGTTIPASDVLTNSPGVIFGLLLSPAKLNFEGS